MKIQVTGEDPASNINVVGGVPSMVIEATVGTVFSVMGQTGAVTGLALAADVVAAQDAAEADATAKVAAHVAAIDPHGDRAWASGQFLTLAGGSLTGTLTASGAVTAASFNTDGTVRSANFRTQSDTEHALTVYQRATGTSPGSVALNVISDKPGDSAMWLTGHETARGTLKIAHLNGGATATADAGAAAISIDLQWNGKGGTAAQGIFLTATEGATTGNLITLRNAASPIREDFVVKSDGKVGIRIPVGNTPLGILQVGMVDDTNVGLFIKANSATGQQSILIQDSAGANRFEISAGGSAVHRASSYFTSSIQVGATSLAIGGLNGAGIGITNSTAEPTSNPTGGGVLYSFGGALKWRSSSGTVFDTTKRTVTGSRGGNAALASLLTQLATVGLITDSSTA